MTPGRSAEVDGVSGRPRSSAHFEALVESSEDAILSKDTQGVITSWNGAAERLYGWAAEEAVGRPIGLIIPPDHANEENEILGKVLAGERLAHYETVRVAKDGTRVHVSLTVSPIRDEDDEIIGASVVARDIGDRVLARQRAEGLLQVTSALGREAEPDRAMSVLLSSGIEVLGADAATVCMLDASGENLELVGSEGHSDEGLSGWESFPVTAEVPMSQAVRELAPVWSPSPEALVERFPALGGAGVRFGSLAVLPLSVEDRPLGAISFSFAEPRRFTAEEQAFMSAVVQQAAHNLDRATAFAAERRARRRVSFIARASEALSESLDTRGTLERLAELSVRHICDWCTVDMVDERGEVENVTTAHVDRSKVALAEEYRRRYPPDPDVQRGSDHVIRTGRSELYEEVREELLLEIAQDDDHMDMIRELGVVSAMVVPLRARGRTLGTITFASSDPERRFDADDLELAEDLARRAALAIDTSTLYEREHETALTLQRALLPGTLPEVEGVELAARYMPAEAGLEVGGDWFDVIQPSEGRVDLVIGDVSGRGVRAAAVMGRLAIALRAYAIDDRAVEAVVGGVNKLLGELDSPEIATLFQLSLFPQTRAARYVRAGHPPPLLRTRDGQVTELGGEGSPPIGWRSELEFSPNTVTLPEGSTLLLYTDGLIERRDSDLDAGIERLKLAFATAPPDPEAIVHEIPAALGAERVPDDIALLAARIG